MKSQSQTEFKAPARKRKFNSLSVSVTKIVRQRYGPESVHVTEDVSDDQLNENYIATTQVEISDLERSNIDTRTIMWYIEMKESLTSSSFSDVLKRRPKTPAVCV